jgi:Helix-turn-helix domain
MPPLAQPGGLRLAQCLRDLRERRWPEAGLTQAMLARALGSEGRLSPATVSSWESVITPKLPPRSRLLTYARFFATHRSIEGDQPRLFSFEDLTDDERDAYEALETELLALRDAAKKPSVRDEAAVTRSWHFSDAGPVTVICAQLPRTETGSLADPADPNYTELLSYADLDALVELHGHIRAENSTMGVFFKLSPNVVPDDLSGHVVLLGGIAWNDKTQRISEMTNQPVRQIEGPEVPTGEIFVVERNGIEERFLPKWGNGGSVLIEDVGLLVRTRNPLNSNRSLTICNGIHSRGVLGSVRALTDERLRDSNEKYIVENFADPSNFAILMRVSVIAGQAMTPDFHATDCVLYQWPTAA